MPPANRRITSPIDDFQPAIASRRVPQSGPSAHSGPERPYHPPEHADPVDERSFRASRLVGRLLFGGKRRAIATMAVVALGAGDVAWSLQQDPADGSVASCVDDASHDLVKFGNTSDYLGILNSKDAVRGTLHKLSMGHLARDNRTWNQLAAVETKRWGYEMTGAALAQANPDMVTPDANGSPRQEINTAGSYCVALAAPQIPDVETVDGQHTVEYYWSNHASAGLTLKTFFKLNPGLSGDKQQRLEAGKVLVFSKHPESGLVYREMTEANLGELTHDDAKAVGYLKQSQPANIAIKHGQEAYLPPLQTEYMKAHNITPAKVLAQFAASYVNLGYGQVVKPKHARPPRKTGTTEAPVTSPGSAEVTTNLTSLLAAADKLEALGGDWKYPGMFMNFFLRKGMSPVAISGLIGNCFAESSCNPKRVQGDRPDSDTLPPDIADQLGYGWMQWTTKDRQQRMLRIADQMGLLESDPRVQLQLIWEELSGPYKHVLHALQQARTPQEASDIVLGPHQKGIYLVDGYENPLAATAHKYRRRTFSVNNYAMFVQQLQEAS